MTSIAEREQLIRNVACLRRAERACPACVEIVAVRADLERAIGPTATRAVAARLLGVSQTALDRWISLGDVSAVVGRTGRIEVPLHALLELMDAVDEHRRTNPDERHPLAAVLRERRVEAEGLSTRAILPSRYLRGDGRGHRDAELRSLAYHRTLARRVDERIVRDARDRLARWLADDKIDPRLAREWEKILSRPPAEIARQIVRDTPRSRDLRQSSPLAGSLTEPERQRALSAVGEGSM